MAAGVFLSTFFLSTFSPSKLKNKLHHFVVDTFRFSNIFSLGKRRVWAGRGFRGGKTESETKEHGRTGIRDMESSKQGRNGNGECEGMGDGGGWEEKGQGKLARDSRRYGEAEIETEGGADREEKVTPLCCRWRTAREQGTIKKEQGA